MGSPSSAPGPPPPSTSGPAPEGDFMATYERIPRLALEEVAALMDTLPASLGSAVGRQQAASKLDGPGVRILKTATSTGQVRTPSNARCIILAVGIPARAFFT